MSPARIASPRTARAINDRTALELLTEHGPLTAARLRDLTGLSRPSVSGLLERLARDGLVTVVGEAGESRRGPNARLYGLVADRAHVAALDVRTGSVSLALADLAGHTVGRATLPVPAGRARDAVPATLEALRGARRAAGIAAVHTAVMGAPGLADPATGALRPSTGLPAWHADLLAALRTELAVPVLLENEVNLAALAEQRLGAVRDRDTFVLLWLGHGTGAAVVLDGALRRGASGGAGEIGFLPVPGTGGLPTATHCGGGFNDLVGDAAVCALARRHGLRAASGGEGRGPAAESVLREARRNVRRDAGQGGEKGPAEGDDGAPAAFLAALADRVAVGAAAVTSVLDPGCLVLGGELGRAGGAELAGRVGLRLRELSPLHTEVRAATVEGSPVLGGALVTALDAARHDLFDTASDGDV